MSARGYTRESVERALDIHARDGRFRTWRLLRVDPSGPIYVVEPWCHEPLVLRSLREAFVFVCGLASADHAARGCCLPPARESLESTDR